jgi:hypothetical protein
MMQLNVDCVHGSFTDDLVCFFDRSQCDLECLV